MVVVVVVVVVIVVVKAVVRHDRSVYYIDVLECYQNSITRIDRYLLWINLERSFNRQPLRRRSEIYSYSSIGRLVLFFIILVTLEHLSQLPFRFLHRVQFNISKHLFNVVFPVFVRHRFAQSSLPRC